MKESNIFKRDYGVMVALDFKEMDGARMVIDLSSDIEGVVGYKVSMLLALNYGLTPTIKELKKHTELPLIYDHQKKLALREEEEEGMCGEKFVKFLKEAGVDGGIFFATIDPVAQSELTSCFFTEDLIPFVLARATWNGVLVSEGGIMLDDAPLKNYIDAAREGVEYYIMPGNRPEEVKEFVRAVSENMPEGTPKICLPGLGLQKGHIRTAFDVSAGFPSYGIIGPVDCIDTSDKNRIREGIKRYSDEALESGARAQNNRF